MRSFEWHGFLPDNSLGKSMVQEIIKNRKRTNAIIAIIKDTYRLWLCCIQYLNRILKNRRSDFEDGFDFIEKKFPNEKLKEETTVPRIRYEN